MHLLDMRGVVTSRDLDMVAAHKDPDMPDSRVSHLHRTPGGCGPPLTEACISSGVHDRAHTHGERVLSQTWTEEQL